MTALGPDAGLTILDDQRTPEPEPQPVRWLPLVVALVVALLVAIVLLSLTADVALAAGRFGRF